MSKYTTQLRWIVEQLGNGLDVPDGQEYANAVYKYIGLDKYPIYNEEYRTSLNDKIIDHFYFREIGFETAAQFAWYMKRTMNEIMPKYNRLYEALETDLNHPLSDYTRHRTIEDDLISKIDNVNKVNEKTNVDGSDHNRNVYQDTPMSLLSNEGSPSVENLDYATNVTYNDDEYETDTERNTNGTTNIDRADNRDKVEDVYGRSTSLASLVDEYYNKFVDIDLMIINELETLFLGLW